MRAARAGVGLAARRPFQRNALAPDAAAKNRERAPRGEAIVRRARAVADPSRKRAASRACPGTSPAAGGCGSKAGARCAGPRAPGGSRSALHHGQGAAPHLGRAPSPPMRLRRSEGMGPTGGPRRKARADGREPLRDAHESAPCPGLASVPPPLQEAPARRPERVAQSGQAPGRSNFALRRGPGAARLLERDALAPDATAKERGHGPNGRSSPQGEGRRAGDIRDRCLCAAWVRPGEGAQASLRTAEQRPAPRSGMEWQGHVSSLDEPRDRV